MIQFNLLPDVKLEYIKARRTQRLVILIAGILGSLALLVFVILFIVVNVWQKQHLSALNNDIAEDTATLQSIPDLDKVLTVQNQLNSLTGLHEKDPAAQRLFGYIGQVTPAQASLTSLKADFSESSLQITGGADSLSTVNQFVDTLKFTTFTTDKDDAAQKAFSDVVLANFSKNDKGVTYDIAFKFNPEIFNNTVKVQLVVPKIISTRSETQKPTDLFQNSSGTGQ